MKVLAILSLLLLSVTLQAQNKSEVIYYNKLTHDLISADVFNGDTIYSYTVTTRKAWTGEANTKIVYKGRYSELLLFMEGLNDFAEEYKSFIGQISSVCGIPVSFVRKSGVKCISIGEEGDENFTSPKSIRKALNALVIWKISAEQDVEYLR